MAPDVTIALTRYAEANELLWTALRSLAVQEDVRADVLVLDQREDGDTRTFVAGLRAPTVALRYWPLAARSLSHARNQALALAATDHVLFIDADAVAAPRWARELADTLARPGVAVAGGRVVPRWRCRPPLLARSRLVREQYSLLDLGEGEVPVPKVVGTNLGVDRRRLGPEAHFDERLGRRRGLLLGGEETDLCRRARAAGALVWYNGRAVVEHQIGRERTALRWLMKKFYYAGISRSLRGGSPAPYHAARPADAAAFAVVVWPYLLGRWYGARRWRRAESPVAGPPAAGVPRVEDPG